MNSQQAKEILSLYRPGTADAGDASFAEALRLCQQDSELKRWFDDHCAVYLAIRAKFRRIEVPEGLKEQILAERNVHAPAFWRRPVLAAAAVLAIFVSVFSLWNQWPHEDKSFSAYQNRMVTTALRMYDMAAITDLDRVRSYLKQAGAPADYAISDNLRKAPLSGCAVATWQGAKVSMICFDSGQPHRPGQTTDLWLIVADRKSLRNPPESAAPVIAKLNRTTTATWTQGDKTYFLIADGDEQFLRRYL